MVKLAKQWIKKEKAKTINTDEDIAAAFRKIAKKLKLKSSDIIYGDRLYEEIFK
ncbi:MAG: hypothetical protein AABY04_01905 [Candidatus Micrarchaeota archaeon]